MVAAVNTTLRLSPPLCSPRPRLLLARDIVPVATSRLLCLVRLGVQVLLPDACARLRAANMPHAPSLLFVSVRLQCAWNGPIVRIGPVNSLSGRQCSSLYLSSTSIHTRLPKSLSSKASSSALPIRLQATPSQQFPQCGSNDEAHHVLRQQLPSPLSRHSCVLQHSTLIPFYPLPRTPHAKFRSLWPVGKTCYGYGPQNLP